MRLFSIKDRPVHLGPFPLERLARHAGPVTLTHLPPPHPLDFTHPDPENLIHAMSRFMGMFDTVRDGALAHGPAEIPENPAARSEHLKSASYYFDASMVGIAALTPAHHLATPHRNPGINALRAELEQGQPATHAAGIDQIYADVLDAARMTHDPIPHHSHALVFLVEYTRDPDANEPGTDWLDGTQTHRAALLANNTAVVIASYLRLLGHPARAHSASTSDVDLLRLAASAGLVDETGTAPYVGQRFALAAVTTTMELVPDQPLAPNAGRNGWHSHGPDWQMGRHSARSAKTTHPFANRPFHLGPYPFETLKRVEKPTTYMDEPRIPRFPKRAEFFARALFGDMGKSVQDVAKGGYYVVKSPIGACARRALGALLLLQFGGPRGPVSPNAANPKTNAQNLKGASYYLSADAVGLCRVPEWAWYSHGSNGDPIDARHPHAVNLLLDQGHETMEGASGDDWISVAQSMRAYLRFSLLGGVIGEQIRRMGFDARVHSVIDGEVLQPPLLLLSGLGEVSRIGEVILNPYLGPRLKSGTVTTTMPMDHDLPIDFGLQTFCNSCNKCARECPSGAITAGPKLMYNGYEIWKSDAEKCTRYRLTNAAGGMCGRCMKTCPWNLEGLFAESAVRWVAMKAPQTAPALAALDDKLGRGNINPVKKWWWDIELDPSAGRYITARATNTRGISPEIDLQYKDQTLAVYPADVMPHPYPVTQPIDREAGIARYRQLLLPADYKAQLARGDTETLAPGPKPLAEPPVFPVIITKRDDLTPDTARFELRRADGTDLPPFTAGAHIDVVVAPEYQRQYSLAGDPADASKYVLGLLREPNGRGGSALMHRIFHPGRRLFISAPHNHFPLDEAAPFSILMAGGIGITPMLTMAHRLHSLNRDFALHYSTNSAGFTAEIQSAPWANSAHIHHSQSGTRADLGAIIPQYAPGHKLYTCGSPRYMDAVFAAATAHNWPETALAREFFATPETPDWVNHPFALHLTKSNKILHIPANQSATDVLAAHGFPVTTKCADGICGVCAVTIPPGQAVEHRDYVLSKTERETRVVLCCSRAAEPNGTLHIEL